VSIGSNRSIGSNGSIVGNVSIGSNRSIGSIGSNGWEGLNQTGQFFSMVSPFAQSENKELRALVEIKVVVRCSFRHTGSHGKQNFFSSVLRFVKI
jgi:hypothetical protein